MANKLDEKFYLRSNVVQVAKDLLGKVLITKISGVATSGIIVETEAYSQMERGCHAYNGKTPRNATMFGKPGVGYVYLCYGIHHMFNVVTNKEGVADAVLVRALQPLQGVEAMLERTKSKSVSRITSGPGKLCKALGIARQFDNTSLASDLICIEDHNLRYAKSKIVACPRIGIDYAGDDAVLPWRFIVKDSPWISKR